MNEGKAISVLVPLTADTGSIEDLHGELVGQLDAIGEDYEVLYLLGAARREVRDQLQVLHEQDPRIRLLQLASTVDPAGMLSAGVENARGDVLFTVPPQLEIDLSALGRLHAAIGAGADLAFASRERGEVGGAARAQSELFNRVVSLASGSHFRDVASGTRAFRRRVAEETPLYGDFYRYLPLLAERLGFRVEEIPARQHPKARPPVVHAPRIYFWRAIDILSIFFISRFTRHPLRLFGGVGSAFAASGGLILAVVAIQRLAGTPLADRPVLVFGTLLVGLGVQAFTIGLLGELILFFHARSIRDYRIGSIYEGSGGLRPDGSRNGGAAPR